MMDVAIVGAGELGGSLAHVLARRGIVRRIQLIDPTGQVAAGKALDIMQAAPIEGFSTPVIGSSDVSRAAGCGLVVVADRVKGDPGTDDLLVLRQLSQLASRAVVVCAGSGGHTLVEDGVRELRYARTRLIGSAPEALSSAVRALVALHTNASVRDVALAVIGLPPSQAFVSWQDATIGGSSATRILGEPALRRLSSQIAPLWPPGPHALAHAAADVVSAICGMSRRAVTCFVAPDDAMGRRARCVALPVRLGIQGVTGVAHPSLDGAARTALENAMLL